MKPWITLATAPSPDGRLELRRRGAADYLITLDGRVIMGSSANRSERALGHIAARSLPPAGGRLLIGGLGLGYTLRAALDELGPADRPAEVIVAELNQVVVDWSQPPDGPLAQIHDDALADPRVQVHTTDVTQLIARAAATTSTGAKATAPAADTPGTRGRYHAIALDLHQGPNQANRQALEPLYGPTALELAHQALHPGGLLAVWGEDPDPPFEKRLRRARFQVSRQRPTGGARRHVITLAHRR